MSKQVIDLHEEANIRVTVKGLIGLVGFVIFCTTAVLGFQFKISSDIERLQMINQTQHETIMIKLTEMDNRQNLYALKRQVEDAIVYVVKQRDQKLGNTNSLAHDDEMKFRTALRSFLQ